MYNYLLPESFELGGQILECTITDFNNFRILILSCNVAQIYLLRYKCSFIISYF